MLNRTETRDTVPGYKISQTYAATNLDVVDMRVAQNAPLPKFLEQVIRRIDALLQLRSSVLENRFQQSCRCQVCLQCIITPRFEGERRSNCWKAAGTDENAVPIIKVFKNAL